MKTNCLTRPRNTAGRPRYRPAVGNPVDDDIDLHSCKAARIRSLVDFANQMLSPRQIHTPRAAIEQIEFKSSGDRLPADRSADEAGAADKQYFHGSVVLSVSLHAEVDLLSRLTTRHASSSSAEVDTPRIYKRFRAVTSISILIRGSARPAEIIMAAGLTAPKYLRSTGQHWGKSAPFGRTYVTRTTS